MDYKDWAIVILMITASLFWCSSASKAHGSEVHLAVGIEYDEPTENLSSFEANAYAVDLVGNKSKKVFAMVAYTGQNRYCGPSGIRPAPEDFRVVQ